MTNNFKKRRKLIFSNLDKNEGFFVDSKTNLNINRFLFNSNIFYFTGIKQPGTKLLLYKDKSGKENEIMFILNKDYDKEKWTGLRISKDETKNRSGIEKVYFNSKFKNIFTHVLNQIDLLYINYSKNVNLDNMNSDKRNFISKIKFNFPSLVIKNSLDLIVKLRTSKDAEEIKNLRKAIEYTKEALYHTWKVMKPGMYEYEIKAVFNHYLNKRNIDIAFNTTVASGENGVILHYSHGTQKVENGDLVLFDVGARFNGYSADISRTVPINGKFTDKQKEIYNIVLKTNKESIKNVKEGVTLKEIDKRAKEILSEELIKRNIIKEKKNLSKYYYHSIGHHLGLDTHDLSNKGEQLANSSVITIEPGLYMKKEKIGIRIEDDILVEKNEGINLSSKIVKEVKDIENLMN